MERYFAEAFGDHLADLRAATEALADRYDPTEPKCVGFRLYARFRLEIPSGNKGWGKKAELGVEKILAVT